MKFHRIKNITPTLSAMLLLLPFLSMSIVHADDSRNAFVRPSPIDPHYLELSDGTPYIPNGFNFVRATPQAEFDATLKKMADNGINYTRVWLDWRDWGIEPGKPGVYSKPQVEVLQNFLDAARRHGIRVMLCLEYFRDIPATQDKWSSKPTYNVANGGPFTGMADFLNSDKGQVLFERKLDFYQQTIGSRPSVFAWELWNEMDTVRDSQWLPWTKIMLPELKKRFPRNMATQSLGSFDTVNKASEHRQLVGLKDNDVAQIHRYLDLGASLEASHAPMDVIAADAVRTLLSYQPGRPVLLSETGAVEPNHAGISHLYAKDASGSLLHDAIFAPFFAGAAGAGDTWWWETAVQKADQWSQYARFAETVKGIDPAREHFQPDFMETDAVRIYGLKGQKTLLVWIRDKSSDWQSELEKGIPAKTISGLEVDLDKFLAGRKAQKTMTYNPWTNTWLSGALKNGMLTLPDFKRSLVVKITY